MTQPKLSLIRERICSEAQRAVLLTERRRAADLRLIQATYAQAGIAALSFAQLLQALHKRKQHFLYLAELARPFHNRSYRSRSGHAIPARESWYALWISNVVEEYFDQVESIARDLYAHHQNVLPDLFAAAQAPSMVENALLEGPVSGLSRYEAKSALCYALAREQRNGLIEGLQLSFDLGDVFPDDYHPETAPHEFDTTLVSEGYFYGALRSNAQAYLKEERSLVSFGIDCSTLVQEAYEAAGFAPELFTAPISTRHMLKREMPGFEHGFFDVVPLHDFSQLVPGDAILWPGHVVIYQGRDGEGRPLVIEALGRRFRTVHSSYMPELDPVTGTSVFAQELRPLYIFRPSSKRFA